MTAAELVTRSLEDRDPAAVSAAAECAERMERSRAVKLLANELDSRRGEAYVLPLLSTAGRMGESSLQELAVGAADRLGIRLGTELVLDAKRSRALLALAALGADVEASLPEAKKPDFFRDARTNAIRAASGDAVALAKLVETANVAADLHLRREAVDLALLLPPEPRLGALRGLASRVTEPDGGVRGRMVRELSRAAGSADAWIEPLLVKAAADPFPDVRLHALCGLLDRGALSAEVRASLPAKDSDPFANAALRAIPIATPTPSPSPEPSPSPAPIASPSPVPSASSAPVPSRTPYRWGR